MIDNLFVEGSSTPVSRQDDRGNTYQIRTLENGTVHEILKNFPDKKELERAFQDFGKNVKVTFLDYYWIVNYLIN